MRMIYLMEIAPLLAEDRQAAAYAYVDRERRERLLSIKSEKSRAQSLAAGLLLSYAVLMGDKEEGHIPETTFSRENGTPVQVTAEQILTAFSSLPEELVKQHINRIQVKRTPSGKPCFVDRKGLFFSLSHSGAYVVCALAEEEIGVDIQQERRSLSPGFIKRILHEREDPDRTDVSALFRLWTAKEAYVKCTGEGLKKDFRELYADFEDGFVTDTVSGRSRKLYTTDCLSGYALALCTDAL